MDSVLLLQPVETLASYLDQKAGFKYLPDHMHTIVFAFLACFGIQLFLSPFLSSRFFPKSYPNFKPKTRRDWDIRFVAFLHAIFATASASYILMDPVMGMVLRTDKVWAYQKQASDLLACSTGYFAWDLLISTIHFRSQGPGFFIHALSCFAVYLASFRPFLNYFGVVFLLWETSSIFLGIHWALDKLDLTGSVYQLINGAFLLTTFSGIRLIWGAFHTWEFSRQSMRPDVQAVLPPGVPYLYNFVLASLQSLNLFWFWQMIKAIKKRFDGSKREHEKRA